MVVQEKLPRFSATIDEVHEEKEFANRQYGKLLGRRESEPEREE